MNIPLMGRARNIDYGYAFNRGFESYEAYSAGDYSVDPRPPAFWPGKAQNAWYDGWAAAEADAGSFDDEPIDAEAEADVLAHWGLV